MTPPERSLPALLSACRALRGVSQGYLLVTLLPDLHLLGQSSLLLGLFLSGALLVDFFLTAVLGLLADRLPPGRILLAGDLLGVLSPIPYLIHPGPVFLAIALLLSGAGQRSNGSPGPWAPPEQVLLSRHAVSPVRPFAPFGWTMGAGLLGMAAGALLAWGHPLPPTLGVRGGLAGLSFLSLGSLLLILTLPDGANDPPVPRRGQPGPEESHTPPGSGERRRLTLLVLSNILGGLSLGLVDPVIATWFLLRFHGSLGGTALYLALAFGAAGLVALVLGRMPWTRALPATVILLQTVALAAAFLLPFAPSLIPAALLYGVRTAGTRAPGGIRQALALALLPPRRSGLAAGLHLSSLQAAQIAGPLLAGLLWQEGQTDAPLLAAGLLSAGSLSLFWSLSRSVPLPGGVRPPGISGTLPGPSHPDGRGPVSNGSVSGP